MTETEKLYLTALEDLLRLSNHYAELLNMHDGGQRRTFASASEWIKRLEEVKK